MRLDSLIFMITLTNDKQICYFIKQATRLHQVENFMHTFYARPRSLLLLQGRSLQS